MIDIHCHLLPGIDDGASTIEQSLDLARHAIADGITHVVVTPHIQPGVYDNNLDTISRAYALFVEALDKNDLQLKVAMAAEVRLCPEIIPMLEAENLPLFVSSEGKRTILLELPHSHVPPGKERLIQWLQVYNINVLIAHPERNKGIMSNYSKAKRLFDMGCLLQLTSGSVSGRFGEPPRRAAQYMLQQGWVSLLASDAHNLRSRPPELSDGKAAAMDFVGTRDAGEMVLENPWQLVGGMFDR